MSDATFWYWLARITYFAWLVLGIVGKDMIKPIPLVVLGSFFMLQAIYVTVRGRDGN